MAALAAAVTLSACGGAAPTPPSQPTVQAVATQAVSSGVSVAGTAQAAASPAAATAQAAASPVVGTAIAAGGTAIAALAPSASPSPSPSPVAQAPVRIADASLADSTPWVSIQNTSNRTVDLGGWHLQVGSASAALPDDAVVEPGGTLTLHAGTGLGNDDELFLGQAGDLLASAALPGTPVRLTDARGQLVTEATVPRF